MANVLKIHYEQGVARGTMPCFISIANGHSDFLAKIVEIKKILVLKKNLDLSDEITH